MSIIESLKNKSSVDRHSMNRFHELKKKKKKGSGKKKKMKKKDGDNSDNYKEIRLLGKGAFGRVLLVERKSDGALFAQKIMGENSEERKNRPIVVEIDTLKKCDSEYIIKLNSTFKEVMWVNLILEYMDGGSIRDVINKVIELDMSFPEHIIAEIAYRSLLGLQYLQENNFLHRDIKPANILVNTKGEVKLADLGMAGKKKKINTTYLGTMVYMSPEQFLGESHGFNCDIWSLGLTICECAILHFPFVADYSNPWAIYDLLNKFRTERKLLDERLFSPQLRDFVDKMLTIEKEERPQAKDLLKHSFLVENCVPQQKHEPSLEEWIKDVLKKAEELKKQGKKNQKLIERKVVYVNKDGEECVKTLSNIGRTDDLEEEDEGEVTE